MVLDASLLNTQQYEVRIKGKVKQPKERSSTFPYTLVLNTQHYNVRIKSKGKQSEERGSALPYTSV